MLNQAVYMPSFDHSTYPDRIGFSFAKDTLDAYKAKREEMNPKDTGRRNTSTTSVTI